MLETWRNRFSTCAAFHFARGDSDAEDRFVDAIQAGRRLADFVMEHSRKRG